MTRLNLQQLNFVVGASNLVTRLLDQLHRESLKKFANVCATFSTKLFVLIKSSTQTYSE